MKDADKPRDQLIAELVEVRERNVELEASGSERKRAKEALRESEQKYLTLLEASFDMIFVIGRDDNIQYANPVAAKAIRRPIAEIVGKPRASFFPAEVASHQKQSLDHVFSTGNATLLDYTLVDGDVRWEEVHLIPIKGTNGRVDSVLGISRNITERKRAEETLRESEEKHRAYVENAPDGIFVVNSGGR